MAVGYIHSFITHTHTLHLSTDTKVVYYTCCSYYVKKTYCGKTSQPLRTSHVQLVLLPRLSQPFYAGAEQCYKQDEEQKPVCQEECVHIVC